MANTSLPLSAVFNVSVVVAPQAASGPSFNELLIVGPSNVIPSSQRTRRYTSLQALLTDGFATNSPEYLAASLYYAQTPQPVYLSVGRQDLTALQTVTVGATAGSGYVVGDIVTVVQTGASGGQLQITSVGSGGAVTGLQIVPGQQGTGYTVANNLTVTGGTGTGLEVNITNVGETPLQAVTACRAASNTWYLCTFVGTAQDSDHEAIAAFIEGATPFSQYFISTSEPAILNNTTPNLGAALKTSAYRRTFTLYSTTQSGIYPNNAYAAAAAAGKAMGLNTGAAGSYFTEKFKQLAGVATEPLSQTQVSNIEALNVNLYLSYANGSYSWLEQGVQAAGVFFDEVLFLDMLASQLQTAGVNLLVSVPALPITDAGVRQLVSVLSQVCDNFKSIGFIAPSGVWNGQTVGPVTAGTALPKGYYIYAPSVSTLTGSQRSARQFPPISILLQESQSAHSLSVTIYVQR
jgi:hypothetical protein